MPFIPAGSKRRIKFWLLNHLAAPFVTILLHLLRQTIRREFVNREELDRAAKKSGGKLIYAFWHGELASCAFFASEEASRRPIYVIVSPSRDGEFLIRIIRWFQSRTVRGSSASRSYGALKEGVHVLEKSGNLAIALDGPRGPRYEVKNGALLLAKKTGAALIPICFTHSSAWRFKSWDRFALPKPFSRLQCHIHPAIFIPSDADKATLTQLAGQLKHQCSTESVKPSK